MKKNKLIELLNSIEGNPDIYIWNGFVEDYQDIDPKFSNTKLVKENKEFLKRAISFEYSERGEKVPENINEKVNQVYKNYDWKLLSEFESNEDIKLTYGNNVKNVVVLDLKSKGKTYCDRIGAIKY